MKNTLGDLNNHLFAEMERLSDENLTGDKLAEEIQRSVAVQGVAEQIIENANLVLKAQMAYLNTVGVKEQTAMPKMLMGESHEA